MNLCDSNSLSVYRDKCDSLFDEDWMQECRDLVGVSDLISACYIDYCLKPDEETLLNIYEAFFSACRETIGDQGPVCTWKTELGLVSCENGKEWSACGSECDVLSRCGSEPFCNRDRVLEGCFCPENTVWHEGSCLEIIECPSSKLHL